MKLKAIIILLVLAILLAISLFFAGKIIMKLNDKIDNLETTVFQMDSTNKVVLLDNKSFKRVLNSKLDSIEARTDIKNKYITNVTEIHKHYYKSDSIIYVAPEISKGIFDIGTGDKCWGFDGTFNIKTKKVNILNKWANDDITIYGYFKRDNLLNKKWLPRWGTKRTFLGSYSSCGGKTEVTEYKLEKKK